MTPQVLSLGQDILLPERILPVVDPCNLYGAALVCDLSKDLRVDTAFEQSQNQFQGLTVSSVADENPGGPQDAVDAQVVEGLFGIAPEVTPSMTTVVAIGCNVEADGSTLVTTVTFQITDMLQDTEMLVWIGSESQSPIRISGYEGGGEVSINLSFEGVYDSLSYRFTDLGENAFHYRSHSETYVYGVTLEQSGTIDISAPGTYEELLVGLRFNRPSSSDESGSSDSGGGGDGGGGGSGGGGDSGGGGGGNAVTISGGGDIGGTAFTFPTFPDPSIDWITQAIVAPDALPPHFWELWWQNGPDDHPRLPMFDELPEGEFFRDPFLPGVEILPFEQRLPEWGERFPDMPSPMQQDVPQEERRDNDQPPQALPADPQRDDLPPRQELPPLEQLPRTDEGAPTIMSLDPAALNPVFSEYRQEDQYHVVGGFLLPVVFLPKYEKKDERHSVVMSPGK